MMAAQSALPENPRPPPWDVRCKACGEWIVTVSSGTAWVRARCANRKCLEYGKGRTMYR